MYRRFFRFTALCSVDVTLVLEIFTIFIVTFSELKKLSEESLTRQPEEVFDIICKLGEG